MRRFKCNLNGCCCRNFMGRQGSGATAQRVFERCNSEGPGYYFIPPEQWAPPLFESEVKGLTALAKKKKIKLSISPLFFTYDLERGAGIVLHWCFVHSTCPFLRNNRCAVYDDRPLACRSFPLLYPPRLGAKEYAIGDCPAIPEDLLPKNAGTAQLEKILREFFGKEIWEASVLRGKTQRHYETLVGGLVKSGRFNPLTGPLHLFAAKINHKNFVGAEEYAKRSGVPELQKETAKTRMLLGKSAVSSAASDASVAELLRLLESGVKKSAPKGEFGLLFSGGLDSLVLAVLLKKLGFRFRCFFGYVDGVGRPKDLAFALRAAKRFGLRLETASVNIGELPALLEKIVPLIKSGSPVDAGIALPLFIACGRAKKRGVKAVFSGQGADELFLGYARFKSSSDLEADSAAALGKLLRSDLRWNRAIAEANGLKLETPFLGKKIMKFAGSLPNSQKISGGRNKVILRELAGALGIPPEFAERGKTAAQYGSNSDRAIERLAKKEGKTKSWYIAGLAEKKKARIAALFSGGKDSCLALWLMQRQNYGVACLVSVIPENPDSFMYHKPDLNILKMQSEALGIPLVVKKTKGDKEKELSALREALAEAKEKFGVEGVVSGALYSNYQRERIQKICNSMRLRLFSPLWHLRQEDELRELRRSGFVFVLTKIAAMGLGGKWLGKEISEDEIKQLEGISYKIGFNVAGEGGEYESLVLDAPNFKKRIVIKKSEKKMSGDFTGVFLVKSASLERKKKPRAQIN